MKDTVFIFSGQGTQYVGMAKELCNKFKVVSDIFEEASDILKLDIKKLFFQGDLKKLTDTKNAQPAILTAGYAAYQAFIEEYGIIPSFMAGHSLGEITALTAANAIIFSDALHIVKKRGELMHNASEKTKGSMAAVYNLDLNKLNEICEYVTGKNKKVVVSNLNSKSQTVISGSKEGINEAIKLIEKEDFTAIELNVSGAFHSPLMEEAAYGFNKYLKSFVFRELMIPVISSVDGKVYQNESIIEEKLTSQLTQPVLWTKVIEEIMQKKPSLIIESGPKDVLTKMLKRDGIMVECFSFEKNTDFIIN